MPSARRSGSIRRPPCARRYRALAGALADAGLDAHVHYAVKANDRLAVLRLFAAEGAGADVVSEGELRRAREAGIPADRIVFSGVGKSERELRLALAEDIAQINVESAEELDMLVGARRRAWAAPRASRCASTRMSMPAPMPRSPPAGRRTSSASPTPTPPRSIAAPPRCRGSEPVGLATHIGSQILSLAPYRAAYRPHGRPGARAARGRACRSASSIAAAGSASPIATSRRRCPPRWPAPSAARCTTSMCAWWWSRGAGWSGRPACCWRPSSWRSTTQGSRFVVLDAAMNDLIRPAMYDAWHGIVPVSAADAVAPRGAGRRRRAGLRDRRHLRAQPPAAAAGAGRPRGDPGCRRLWFGDEFGLQRAPAGGRGDGGRQQLVGDPRARRPTPTCGAARACHIGCRR